MTYWFSKKTSNVGTEYNSKSISLDYMIQHFWKFHCKSNGAVKGVDKCYDLNIHFFGVMFSYTNWDYNLK